MQGTISILIGVHSPVHSLLVALAWHKLCGRWPKLWELACIFLHDIGHVGLDYLDDQEQKAQHWRLGARIARRLFGQRGWALVAGHCDESDVPRSRLHKADKYSWYIAPYWWLYWNNLVEPTLMQGMSNRQAVLDFQQKVKQSIETGEYRSTHQIYLARCEALKEDQ